MDNVAIGSEQFASRLGYSGTQPTVSSDAGLLKYLICRTAKAGSTISMPDFHYRGKTGALKVVAEILASMTLPYPGTGEMHSYGFSMSDISMYGGRQTITADKTYDFKTLDQPTHSFKGLNPNPIILSFRLPPDFLIKQNQYAKLSLNLSYGGGLRAGSASTLRSTTNRCAQSSWTISAAVTLTDTRSISRLFVQAGRKRNQLLAVFQHGRA